MITLQEKRLSPVGRLRGFYRYAVRDTYTLLRTHGFRETVRRRGWKFLAGVLAYYLVRDTLLYVVVPLWLTGGLF